MTIAHQGAAPVSQVVPAEPGKAGRKSSPLHRDEIIIGLREDGRTYQQISKVLGVTARQVEKAVGEIAALYASGESIRDIAAIVGAPIATVHRVLHPNGRANKKDSPHTAPAMNGLADMYGMQVDVLAWYLNVHVSTVYKLVKQLQADGLILPKLYDAGPGMNWVIPTRDAAGSYLGWVPRVTWRPPPQDANHYRAVAQARVMLVGAEAERWLSERRLRHAAEVKRYESRGRHAYTQPHMHDGRFLGAVGGTYGWWAVEVELTAKSAANMDKALRGAIGAARDAEPDPLVGVLYLCRGSGIQRVVDAAAARLPAHLDDAVGALAVLDFDNEWTRFLKTRTTMRAAASRRPVLRIAKDAS